MKDPLPKLAAESTSNYHKGELLNWDEVQAMGEINLDALRAVADRPRRDVAAEKENIK